MIPLFEYVYVNQDGTAREQTEGVRLLIYHLAQQTEQRNESRATRVSNGLSGKRKLRVF